jgi:hypothetical protein
MGIAVCAVAASAMILLMIFVNDVLRGVSIGAAVTRFWSISLFGFLLGYALLSIFALPSVIAIAIGAHALAARRHDSFIISTACGAAIGYIVLSITAKFTLGSAPIFDLRDASNVRDAALLLLNSSMISGLYWLVAVRRDRNKRALEEKHERALRAME